MSLKVIGTGLGRTGTFSLKLALEKLALGKCYHMYELFKHPENLHYFEDAEKGKPVNWYQLFENYRSAVDYPVARYYKKVMGAYPEAKVIHTQRDAEAWYESCVETIFWACKPSPARVLNLMVRLPFSKAVRGRFPVLKFDGSLMDIEFGKDLKDKKKVIASYNLHNEEVLRTVPPEKLLVFNVKDGWEPLCGFLNVPVPNEPFPKSNTRAEFMEKVKMISNGSPLE